MTRADSTCFETRRRRKSRPMLDTTDPWPSLRDAKKTATVIAAHARDFYGDNLESVWLYGSRARGDHRPDSDLDVLLVRHSENLTDPIEQHRDRVDEPFKDMLEERMAGYSALFTPIQINSVRPQQLRTWDTMFFRSVRKHAIRVL